MTISFHLARDSEKHTQAQQVHTHTHYYTAFSNSVDPFASLLLSTLFYSPPTHTYTSRWKRGPAQSYDAVVERTGR